MALIRCTCIYRPCDADELAMSGSPLILVCRDPHCPAGSRHNRADRTPSAPNRK